jgi:hypothetical protein
MTVSEETMTDGPIPAVRAPEAVGPAPSPPRGTSASGRALGTVLFFAVCGPLIGGLILGFRDMAYVAGEGRDLGRVLYFLFALLSVGVPAAYAMGLVPAAIVGLFFAVVDYGRVRSDPWLAVVVGALGGMLWPVPWGSGPSSLSSPLEVQLFIASIVSTFVCWYASTRGARRRERMAAP